MMFVTVYFQQLSAAVGEGWNRFWFTPGDPRPTSLLRVLTGLLACYLLLSHSADLIRWFGPHGLLPPETVRELTVGAGRFSFRPSPLNAVQAPSLLWAIHAAAVLAAAAFAAGLFSRVTNALTLLAVLAYIHRAPMITGQFEPVLSMLLIYLLLAPTGAAWSLDRRLGRIGEEAAGQPSLAGNISLRLIQLHLCGLYMLTGLSMLSGQVWWSGEAAWWLIARPDSRPFDLTGLYELPYLINIWTHAIVLLMLTIPLLIWNRLARPLVLVAAALLWLLVALLTGLWAWSAAMITASLAFLPLPPASAPAGDAAQPDPGS